MIAAGLLLWWPSRCVRGVNPFRRMLGGVILLATLVGLAMR